MRPAGQLANFVLESRRAAEVYLTVTPPARAPAADQLAETFHAAAEALREAGARIFQERVFGTPGAMAAALEVRARAYADLAEGPAPALLVSPAGPHGEVAGLQVHAVCGDGVPEPLPASGAPAGRVLRLGQLAYVSLSQVSAAAGSPPAQARAALETAETLLRQAGGDMRSVARTWLWLGDILSWYDDFNRVRTRFFAERGLTGAGPAGRPRVPASTGIGVPPACPSAPGGGGDHADCALDLLAIIGAEEDIEFFPAAGRQGSPYAYGSAFSRAARAGTPGGETVWVSGTAAIDAEGITRRLGDVRGQIDMTLANVRAVLGDAGCRDEDVVGALAYSKTPQVEEFWLGDYGDLPWPCVSVISDICRGELLFELEVTACGGARRR